MTRLDHIPEPTLDAETARRVCIDAKRDFTEFARDMMGQDDPPMVDKADLAYWLACNT